MISYNGLSLSLTFNGQFWNTICRDRLMYAQRNGEKNVEILWKYSLGPKLDSGDVYICGRKSTHKIWVYTFDQ